MKRNQCVAVIYPILIYDYYNKKINKCLQLTGVSKTGASPEEYNWAIIVFRAASEPYDGWQGCCRKKCAALINEDKTTSLFTPSTSCNCENKT